ncbi:MAG: AAA family ATPase [Oscillatoriaceae cyanobacterium Prado104]|jgi:PAS domain S-box-containing protein|nr:AAA family ATPase [Oscillatoriaceae cyanobacterium Prado104]
MTVALPGYQLEQAIYTGNRTTVYRGHRESDNQPVVIKFLSNAYPTFSELLQFRNQYTTAKNLNIPGIIRPESLESCGNSYALVMEDFGAISLAQYNQTHSLELTQFLEIARQMADILHDLHGNRVIHKDIKPANILIHPDTKQIKLIDFSIASLLPKETQEIKNPDRLEGTLAYLAPEQTGRMNRGIDYRSDFYSLGVTLFELLAGQLPFESNDAMELVHCHIAKQPPSLTQFNIPETIANIVAKLMAKNAEFRYQSALGLKYDLEKCLFQLQETGAIEPFELGERDRTDRFIIPEKLYGRETEVQILLDAFDRISKGTAELMLVAGFSGIGKTAVVNEVHKPIVRQKGYFIKGKYDQFNRNIPFSAFVQALRDLMGQLLSESDAKLRSWKTKILNAVGESGSVIIEVIPELEMIIGKQPEVAELSGTAAQNRFNLLFQKFVRVFASIEHPLVIFLDDLQWADSASLKLLELLMNDAGYLLILGAYRDNEVSPAHPFILTVDGLKKAGVTANTIELQPLSQSQLDRLVADTLRCSFELAKPLTELVYQKTQGNPFFTVQFLKALHDDKFIEFNAGAGYWQCDLAQIKRQILTDDVVEFMAIQLQKLPAETQNVLKLAACIGAQFDSQTLGIVCKQSETETAAALWKALQEGLILPVNETYKFFQAGSESSETTSNIAVPYRFLHDRVQQAAYSLIPDNQKQATHLGIGRLLQQNLSELEKEEKLFDIVGHLNLAIELITHPKEREVLAQMNASAGQKARNSTAYAAARKFVQTGLELLSADCWQSQYELTLNLHVAAAETAYLNGDLEGMENMANHVLQSAKTLLDKVKVYEIKITALTAQSQMVEAISVGKNALAQLGVEFSSEPDDALTGIALQTLASQLKGKQIEKLVNLPAMSDPQTMAVMQLLAILFTAVVIGNPALLPLLCSTMVSLSLQYGNAPASTIGYAGYGVVLSAFFGEIEKGYSFGRVALSLLERLNLRQFKSLTLGLFVSFIQHRIEAVRATIPTLKEGYLAGMETGDFLNPGYNIFSYFHYNLIAGVPFDDWEGEIEKYCVALARVKQDSAVAYLKIVQQIAYNLRFAVDRPDLLIGSAYDERVMVPKHIQDNESIALPFLYVHKLMLACFFSKHAEGLDCIVRSNQYLMSMAGLINAPVFHFYASLTYLALCGEQSEIEKAKTLESVETHQKNLAQWARHAPMNHQHKVDLIEAEKCRVFGKNYEAGDWYDRAISLAKENEYTHEEALANELAAKFYLNRGKEKVAAGYMQEAYYCYAKWGAGAKTADLEQRYPHLLKPILQSADQTLNPLETLATLTSPQISIHSATSTSRSSSYSINNVLDFVAIIQASQSLSSTIQLDELLCQLTQIMLQNSGGEFCALIIPDSNGEWQLRAIATPESSELCSQLLENNLPLPVKLIQYVKNTQEVVVIDELKTDLPVIDDYLHQHKPLSVLCLPILNRGQLYGILYLENRSASRVFANSRILILKFLCTQAGIALENAQLHAREREKSYHLEQSQIRLKLLLQQTPVAVMEWNTNCEFQFWNPAAEKMFGYRAQEVLGQHFRCIIPEEYHAYVDGVAADILAQRGGTHAIHENITKDGQRIICEWFNAPMFNANGEVSGGVSMGLDITNRKTAEMAIEQKSQELERALQELQQAQLQIVQSEKMSALGNLVAGVAHEINNPVGCIIGNVGAAQDYINDLLNLIDLYQEELPQPSAKIAEELEAIDLDYVREDLPKLIKAMQDGGTRIKSISQSLRTFSRADSDVKQAFNIHEGIDSTVLILRHRLKANNQRPEIKIISDCGNLPEIKCFPGQLNQVFMNILANAIDAIDELNTGRSFAEIEKNPNCITIRTMVEGEFVKIEFADNGKGMSSEVKSQIFNHLFTTKEVGKGTGLGLAIARQIIVEKHGGTIEVNSEIGTGTKFVLLLPIT